MIIEKIYPLPNGLSRCVYRFMDVPCPSQDELRFALVEYRIDRRASTRHKFTWVPKERYCWRGRPGMDGFEMKLDQVPRVEMVVNEIRDEIVSRIRIQWEG